MSKHLQYARYIWRHVKHVRREGRKLGLGWGQLFRHDLSKLQPDEWFPYVEHFYGNSQGDRGFSYDRSHDLDDETFNLAWLKHVHRNPHHWQYWILHFDDGGYQALPMPDRYRKEMLADWRGAGAALGHPDTIAWYEKNKGKMELHPETREWIEYALKEMIQ